jgi:hypothetical protein
LFTQSSHQSFIGTAPFDTTSRLIKQSKYFCYSVFLPLQPSIIAALFLKSHNEMNYSSMTRNSTSKHLSSERLLFDTRSDSVPKAFKARIICHNVWNVRHVKMWASIYRTIFPSHFSRQSHLNSSSSFSWYLQLHRRFFTLNLRSMYCFLNLVVDRNILWYLV